MLIGIFELTLTDQTRHHKHRLLGKTHLDQNCMGYVFYLGEHIQKWLVHLRPLPKTMSANPTEAQVCSFGMSPLSDLNHLSGAKWTLPIHGRSSLFDANASSRHQNSLGHSFPL